MKKAISIIALLALMTVEFIGANFNCETEKAGIVETEELPDILTDADLSKLYTCKQDIRKKDKSIVEVSYEDARLLLCMSREEGGPTLDGQLWSMRTILNRLCSNEFPNSVYDVISQDGQFEVFLTGKYVNADVNANSHIALAMIEGGWNDTQGALYWEADTNSDESWHKQNLEYIATVEGNIYYR